MKRGSSRAKRPSEVPRDALLHEDLAGWEAMDEAARERELEEMGWSAERMRGVVAAARAKADADAGEKPGSGAKVVDLRAVREQRRTRWTMFAVAASVALVAGSLGSHELATTVPHGKVDCPTYVAPPPPWARARPLMEHGLRQCAMHYWGECQDSLDQAKDIWPEGKDLPKVKAARKAMADAHVPESPGSSPEHQVEPNPAPGERPLQRTP